MSFLTVYHRTVYYPWLPIYGLSKMKPPVLVAMAVRVGVTRLIDNFIYEG